jgi:membrane protease YdiL (CAAX protease family)
MSVDELVPLWSIVWRAGLFLTLWGVLLAAPVVLVAQRAPSLVAAYPQQSALYFEVVTAGAVVAAAWVMARVADGRDFSTVGFASATPLRDLGAGALLGVGWLLLCLGVLWALGAVQSLRPIPLPEPALGWAVAALFLNTITQEVLARGYVFQTIQAHASTMWAIAVSSVLFAAYHAGAFNGSWLAAINVVLAGMLFAVIYVLSGSLWAPIGLHFAWNVLVGPLLGLTVSGRGSLAVGAPALALRGPDILTGGTFGLEASLVVTVATLIVIVVLAIPSRLG